MMRNIVSLTGHKNSGKLEVAWDLSKNSDVAFVKPFTDRPIHDLWSDCYNFVSKERLDELIESLEVLYSSKIGDYRYVFFKNQLVKDYNVLILDDYGVAELKNKYHKYFYSIKIVSQNQRDSERVGVYLYNHEFDKVFDYDNDYIGDLEADIEHKLLLRSK